MAECVCDQKGLEGGEDDSDETIYERITGLAEMFPEQVREYACTAILYTKDGIKYAYSFSRTALWVIFSSSIILFAPIIFEVERAQMEEMQKNQQKQLLLGPNSAISGGVPPPILPPIQKN